jgi:hypothetical protein
VQGHDAVEGRRSETQAGEPREARCFAVGNDDFPEYERGPAQLKNGGRPGQRTEKELFEGFEDGSP